MANQYEEKEHYMQKIKNKPNPELWEDWCAKLLPPKCMWVQKRHFRSGTSIRHLVKRCISFPFCNLGTTKPYKVLVFCSNGTLHILSDFWEQSMKKFWQINLLSGVIYSIFPQNTCMLQVRHISQIQSLPSSCLPEVFSSAALSKYTWSFSL